MPDEIDDEPDDAQLEKLWEKFYESVAPGPDDVRRADALFDELTRKTTAPMRES
jgi:hypothetical protein